MSEGFRIVAVLCIFLPIVLAIAAVVTGLLVKLLSPFFDWVMK